MPRGSPSALFRRLCLITSVATYGLLLFGSVVSSTGSGLACPDWPLCHGRLIPPLEGPILIEWGHRLFASGVGLLVLTLTIVAWSRERAQAPLPQLSLLALIAVLAQAVLGGITVLRELPSAITTAHLGLGLGLFSLLVGMTAWTYRPTDSARSAAPWVWVAALAVYAQAILGAYVRHTGSGLACPDLPLCRGEWLPSLDPHTTVHLLHRLGAILVTLLVLVASSRLAPQAPLGAAIAAALVILQLALGMLTVLTRLSLPVATLHLGVAAALLATLVTLAVRSTYSTSQQTSPA